MTVLCQKHYRYKAILKPRVECEPCEAAYAAAHPELGYEWWEVRYGRHDGQGGPTSTSWETRDDAHHFAGIMNEDPEYWVEINPC